MACEDKSPLGVFDMIEEYAIPQGADWDVALRYLENDVIVNLSSYTAKMQVRLDYGQDVILELNTSDGSIELGSGAGDTPNVILKFRSATTSAMTQYTGIYDLECTSASGIVKKFLKGKFELEREVTI